MPLFTMRVLQLWISEIQGEFSLDWQSTQRSSASGCPAGSNTSVSATASPKTNETMWAFDLIAPKELFLPENQRVLPPDRLYPVYQLEPVSVTVSVIDLNQINSSHPTRLSISHFQYANKTYTKASMMGNYVPLIFFLFSKVIKMPWD